MDGLLRNRDHQGQRHTITVSHNVTIFVPEPWICPLAATKKTPWPSQNVTGFASRRIATLPRRLGAVKGWEVS